MNFTWFDVTCSADPYGFVWNGLLWFCLGDNYLLDWSRCSYPAIRTTLRKCRRSIQLSQRWMPYVLGRRMDKRKGFQTHICTMLYQLLPTSKMAEPSIPSHIGFAKGFTLVIHPFVSKVVLQMLSSLKRNWRIEPKAHVTWLKIRILGRWWCHMMALKVILE